MLRLLTTAIFTSSACLLLSACGSDSPNAIAKVFKSDQSRQCEETGIAPEVMRKELLAAGIDVVCAQKDHDGMMHAAVCGGSTGSINVYLIHSSDLDDAKALGYAPVSELPAYQDKTCDE